MLCEWQHNENIFKALEIAEDYKSLDMIDDALKYAKESLALTPEDEDSLEQVSELENQKLERQEW